MLVSDWLVQEVNSPDALYCFEVISANRRSYTLQAEGPDELKSWVTTMRDSISSQVRGRWGGGGNERAAGPAVRPGVP